MKEIEFPITVNSFESHGEIYRNKVIGGGQCGDLVAVRPCKKELQGKTYLGFLLGEMAVGSSNHYHRTKQSLSRYLSANPAIFVPELKEVIFGYESWWSIIESEEELRQITDEDIENVWYVKLWKSLQKEDKVVSDDGD